MSKNCNASKDLAVDLQVFRRMETKSRWIYAGAVLLIGIPTTYWLVVRFRYLMAPRRRAVPSWVIRRRHLKLMTNPT